MEKQKENKPGHLHILSQEIALINSIFDKMGFDIADGPEIIPESANFDVLNFPADHPARDTHDTFWIDTPAGSDPVVLRTHISSLQVPYMQKHIREHGESPLRMVSTGMVYRAEATDATHESLFHYTEGMVVGKDITLAHLRGTLERFLGEFFGKDMTIRFRPGNFPFVEPGLEVDMLYAGKGSGSARGERWLEMLGCGMVHPQVLKNGGFDPEVYQGFAFGVGVNRLAMIKHDIDDIRLFYGADLRFVNQF